MGVALKWVEIFPTLLMHFESDNIHQWKHINNPYEKASYQSLSKKLKASDMCTNDKLLTEMLCFIMVRLYLFISRQTRVATKNL